MVCPQQRRAEEDREILIAGSVGPYGTCLHNGSEYTGDYVDHMTKEVSHVTMCRLHQELSLPFPVSQSMAQTSYLHPAICWSGPASV